MFMLRNMQFAKVIKQIMRLLLCHITGVGKVFNERATCENSKLPESH